MLLAKEKLGKVYTNLYIMPTTLFSRATCFAYIIDNTTWYK
jgi:hypothetical protein